jgi:CSLREA domain-containing protein
MMFKLSRLLQSAGNSKRRPRRRFKPCVELLEGRLVPATITVTTAADDSVPNDGSVSLREAIQAINNGGAAVDPDITNQNPGTFGVNDTIKFNISGSGMVQTINVGSTGNGALPELMRPVTINGYSETGASMNTLANGDNARILIELNGADAGPNADGLLIAATGAGSTIEGLAINRFSLNGIELQGGGCTIAGNFVGTNPQGTAAEPNQNDGIRISSSNNNIIGGTTPDARNVVSGNQLDGIHVVGTFSSPAISNLIEGNFVGVDAAGTGPVGTKVGSAAGTPAGNFLFGIEISGGNANTVGGATAAAGNVVGFNVDGIDIDNGGQENIIQANYVGVGADGVTPAGNTLHGIAIRSNDNQTPPLGPGQNNEPPTSGNVIGLNPNTSFSGQGNLIEFNGSAGVAVFGNPSPNNATPIQNSGNSILGNSIFENGRGFTTTPFLGIDLSSAFVYPKDDGATANDSKGHGAAGDPNNLQNSPVLTSVTQVSGGVQIAGTLTAAPNTTYRIELFASNSDPLGLPAEGQTFLGATTVTTDTGGKASFSPTLNVILLNWRQVFTADATNTTADLSAQPGAINLFNTSELSASVSFTPQQQFVQALYLDDLGRAGNLSSPSDAGAWVTALTNNTLTPAAVASAIAHSLEARTHLVDGWYPTYLGRKVQNGEEQGWVNLLMQGQKEEQVLSDILGSQEFFNHAQTLVASGTPQERFVQALYQLLFQRTGSSPEVAGWVNLLPLAGQQAVALAFLTSTECRVDWIMAYYSTLLHRTPDASGLAYWVPLGQDLDSVRIDIESSVEFFTNG